MTATFERSQFVQHGTEDNSAEARLAREAERDHHERIAAVRVVAGLARDAGEARDLCAMLGLSDAEVREARRRVTAVAIAVPTVVATGASAPAGGRRRGKVTAA